MSLSAYSEDVYRNMLNSFRSSDLQSLLGAFGRSRGGRKSELKERALELLRTRPTGFNHPAYLTKIVEIYRNMQTNPPIAPNNNEMMCNMMQNQQRQLFMSMNMQSQQPRLFQPPQYSQQTMHSMMRPGLPQMVPTMHRGMYGNNIHYGYQSAGPRMNPVSTNQQHNMGTVDPMGFDVNTGNNSFNTPAQPNSNIVMKKLPFYEFISDIIKPTTLIGQEICTIPSASIGMREATFKFNLTLDQTNLIALNKNLIGGKGEHLYQAQLRICQFESGGAEISDFLPLGLHIRVCGKDYTLPPSDPNNRPGAESRISPRPINCTQYLKLNPIMTNTITINWTPDQKTYIMSIHLIKKLTTDILLQKLKDKGAKSSDETKNYIIQKLADVDPDLATTSYRFSLTCPLGRMRMKIPAKSVNCDHLQCFDAPTFILMNKKKPTWCCPTCNKPCLYDDLQIESYFLDIVTSPNLPGYCQEIEILADGSWRVYEEKEEVKTSENTPDPNKNPIDTVDLDDSDDGNDENSTAESKREPNPESSNPEPKDAENLKSSFIDLTFSDNEEPPREKDKQENEAQAADVEMAAVAVKLKPQAQAQVQPQQAVTSSVQRVVIEIDSPSPPLCPVILPPTTSS